MKAKLGKKAIAIREELMHNIPASLKHNTGLELTVERPEDGGVFINFYIGRAQFPDNYVGYIGLKDGKLEAYFSPEGCANADKKEIFCNKGVYFDIPDKKCPGTKLCDQVREFIIKYAKKYNINARIE
jgi:hypothetical protein